MLRGAHHSEFEEATPAEDAVVDERWSEGLELRPVTRRSFGHSHSKYSRHGRQPFLSCS